MPRSGSPGHGAGGSRFSRFGELPEPRSRTLRFYGTDGTTIAREEGGDLVVTDGDQAFTLDNPDFNVLSYRSNMVLRWEWQPGSTLYLVWQQNRYEKLWDYGAFAFDRDFHGLFATPSRNVFLVKMTYWFNM